MIQLINVDLARDQFEALGPDYAATLAEALQADFAEWSGRLVTAAAAGDGEAIRRARHSLKGLCGNFGAAALEAAAHGPLAAEADRAGLLTCADRTVAEILKVAASV